MQTKKVAAFGVVFIGVALEHFDAMLVNLFALPLATHFVLTSNNKDRMVLGFLGYGISFLFRPLGAAFFGILGDHFGRKPSMLLSLAAMSFATLGLGLIPEFRQIGVLATFLFIVCRIVQGLSVGGEYGAAMTYAYEISGARKTLAGALVISATHFGGLAAALLAMYFQNQFQIPFRIAGVMGLISLGFRSFLVESYSPPSRELRKRTTARVIFQNILSNKDAYGRAFIVASALVFTFYTSIVYLNEVIFQKGLAERSLIFRSNAMMLSLWVLLPPLLGYTVDRFGMSYKKVMILGAACVALIVGPIMYFAAAENSFESWVFAQFGLSIFHCIYCFATPRYLGDLFQQSSRNTGVALGYSLGASFTAALTPLICHGFVFLTGKVEAISLPILIISGLAALQLSRESAPKGEKCYEPI